MMWYDTIWQTRTYKCNIARRITHGKHPVSHHSSPNDFIMAHPAFASFEATLAASGTHHNVFCSPWWWVFCTLIILDTLQSNKNKHSKPQLPQTEKLRKIGKTLQSFPCLGRHLFVYQNDPLGNPRLFTRAVASPQITGWMLSFKAPSGPLFWCHGCFAAKLLAAREPENTRVKGGKMHMTELKAMLILLMQRLHTIRLLLIRTRSIINKWWPQVLPFLKYLRNETILWIICRPNTNYMYIKLFIIYQSSQKTSQKDQRRC